MLLFGQSSSKYLKTEIHKSLQLSICKIKGTGIRTASAYTQKLNTMYTHANHSCRPEAGQSIWVGNCNEDMSLAVSTFTQHWHHLIKCTQMEMKVLRTPFCCVCACVSWVYAWVYSWAWVFFWADSSDLLHMSVYTFMGVISVWELLQGEYGILVRKQIWPDSRPRQPFLPWQLSGHSDRLFSRKGHFVSAVNTHTAYSSY